MMVLAVGVGCGTTPEPSPPPTPGAAASVEEVAERLSDLRDEYQSFSRPVDTCGQTDDEDSWPPAVPTYRTVLDLGGDSSRVKVLAAVHPDVADAERLVDAYIDAAADCPDEIENDGFVENWGAVAVTDDVAPGWEGVQVSLDGGYTNHSAIYGTYSSLVATVRKEALVVQLRWSHLTESQDFDIDQAPNAEYSAAAPELFDTVLERLGAPSASGEAVDGSALSQRFSVESMTGEDFHPDAVTTDFPSQSLTCGTSGWEYPWMYARTGVPGEPPPSTIISERAWITPDTTSGDAMSINQRIHFVDEDPGEAKERYISEMDIGRLCDGNTDIAHNDDGTAYATGPCTDKSYHQESRPYSGNGWEGVIATVGTRCALGLDASIEDSAVEGFVVVSNGPLVVCIRVQTGGGDDLDSAAADVVELLTEALDAMPVS
ncbi:hypothetical protein ACFQ3B_11605 [Stackebrandtia endophytica]|uniref:hypothetical protein n=1 Tax=Stackebrandtia endophytica TaxID=1496996 RepID=UPI001152AFAA|nr:hypothetical protein [Stackebrandtia endophytica]